MGFKLSEGMEVPKELASKFKFARQKSKLAGTIRGSLCVISLKENIKRRKSAMGGTRHRRRLRCLSAARSPSWAKWNVVSICQPYDVHPSAISAVNQSVNSPALAFLVIEYPLDVAYLNRFAVRCRRVMECP